MLVYCSCSYTEIVNNTSPNATSQGLQWTMTNIIPAATGLTVDGVIYQYTTVKNTIDPMTVSVQNKNTSGSGYIFRSTDDWTGLRGNSITKVVPVDNIPGTLWGDGEIATTGKGQVTNASVFYKYRYDTCALPTSDPKCPGYIDSRLKNLTPTDTTDSLSDPFVKNALDTKVTIEEEKKVPESTKEKKTEKVAEKKVIANTLISKENAQTAAKFEALNNIPGFDLYTINISGGVYNDVIRYPEKKLPDSKKARSLGMAQENLHKAMVDSQYK